jgi:hypothetical protein
MAELDLIESDQPLVTSVEASVPRVDFALSSTAEPTCWFLQWKKGFNELFRWKKLLELIDGGSFSEVFQSVTLSRTHFQSDFPSFCYV